MVRTEECNLHAYSSLSLLDHIHNKALSLGLNKIRITCKKKNSAKQNKSYVKNTYMTLEINLIFEYSRKYRGLTCVSWESFINNKYYAW